MAADPYKYFRLEARELIDELGKGTLALEQGPSVDTVARMLRQAHTLKGAARIVRLPEIAERAHAIEDVLAPFRTGSEAIPPDRIATLLALVDELSALLARAVSPPRETTTAAASPTEVPHSVRTELAEMDALLDGVIATHTRLRGVGELTGSLQAVRQLAELVVAQLAPRGAPRDLERTHALAEQLRDSVQTCEQMLETRLEYVDRELTQVRETAEHLRLVSVESTFSSLQRTARDAAEALGKQVLFAGRGGRVRLDAQVLVAIQAALVQLVRNAVAHGIEMPAERRAAGKSVAGMIELEVVRRGRRIVFTCRDDGRGLDLEAVRRVAQRRGFAAPANIGAAELMKLLLRGGISTSSSVTEVSGRGIGLDVVREVVERLGGEVAVRSEPSAGTAFEIVVPVSIASLELLVVEAGGVIVAIPLDAVRGTRRVDDADLARTAHAQSILHADRATPFVPLGGLLRAAASGRPRRGAIGVIVEAAGSIAVIGVDRLVGTSSTVVRPIPAIAGADPLIAGATVDAAGNPQLVLDPEHLVGAARDRVLEPARAMLRHSVLVIDDSMTTRMLEQSILESAGYDVDTATSGEHGLEAASKKRYALFLVDVEMPGIDGFTFVERVRADPALRDTPAILITSRNAAEDRERGRLVGAQGYIVKSEFDQVDLLARIQRMVGLP
ncbi:MAG: CheA signal transduction histidine kinase [Myxococcales bacterium]|nr:CheA signal transduction histidine kinase [Myxococcales bacterium]